MPKPSPGGNIVEMIRASLKKMSASVLEQIGPAPASISESYHDISMRDGYMSSLKVQKPSASAPGPLAVLIYGGGLSHERLKVVCN